HRAGPSPADGPHLMGIGSLAPRRISTNRARSRCWQEARCLVTGASSGLGRALAEQLVRGGARGVLTGRPAERPLAVAQPLIGGVVEPARIIRVPADLTNEGDRQRLFDEVAAHFEALDLVINNAGVGAAGQFETHDPEILRRVFAINVFATAEICRAALPLLA